MTRVIKPCVEYIPEVEDYIEHIAKCAAICYKSENYTPQKMYDRLIKDGHNSMLRHASAYYMIPAETTAGGFLTNYMSLAAIFGKNPYINVCFDKGIYYLSTNRNYLLDNKGFDELFEGYKCTREHFASNCRNINLMRVTLFITTSIKVSRELNRTSPNNIAEQSTRYVNFGKKGEGAALCESIEPDYLDAVDVAIIRDQLAKSCECYDNLVESGVKPEDARRVLPLDCITKCAYTYTVEEWKHILDLRLYETTGKAAPDAKRVAQMIHDVLAENNYL